MHCLGKSVRHAVHRDYTHTCFEAQIIPVVKAKTSSRSHDAPAVSRQFADLLISSLMNNNNDNNREHFCDTLTLAKEHNALTKRYGVYTMIKQKYPNIQRRLRILHRRRLQPFIVLASDLIESFNFPSICIQHQQCKIAVGSTGKNTPFTKLNS